MSLNTRENLGANDMITEQGYEEVHLLRKDRIRQVRALLGLPYWNVFQISQPSAIMLLRCSEVTAEYGKDTLDLKARMSAPPRIQGYLRALFTVT